MSREEQGAPLCPTAQPEMPRALVFAVIDRSGPTARLRYLRDPVPLDDEVRQILDGAPLPDLFRLASRCVGASCGHFDGSGCAVGERVLRWRSRDRAAALPGCALRTAGCRWFGERGGEVCGSCRWHVSTDAALVGSSALSDTPARP